MASHGVAVAVGVSVGRQSHCAAAPQLDAIAAAQAALIAQGQPLLMAQATSSAQTVLVGTPSQSCTMPLSPHRQDTQPSKFADTTTQKSAPAAQDTGPDVGVIVGVGVCVGVGVGGGSSNTQLVLPPPSTE